MSRWSDRLDNHAINETLRQIIDWLNVDVNGIDEKSFDEIERIRKLIEILKKSMVDVDPSLLPFKRLDGINNHLRHQGFWSQVQSFHSNKNIQHLVAANDHLENIIDQIFWISPSYGDSASTGVLSALEDTARQAVQSLSSKGAELESKVTVLKNEIAELSNKKNELEKLIDIRKKDVDNQVSQWQQQFSDAQEKRSDSYNDWKNLVEKEIKQKSQEITAETQNSINQYKQGIEGVLSQLENDSREKHSAILELYQLSSGDSISGGYAKTANDEESQANLWRRISLGFICTTIIWLFLSYVWCNGICHEKSLQLNDCKECLAGYIAAPPVNASPSDAPPVKSKSGDANEVKNDSAGVAESLTTAVSSNNDNKPTLENLKSSEELTAFNWQKFLLNFSLIAVLLFGAGFSSRQSSLHRNESIRTRRFALQVKALDPYISNFDEKDQVELKKQLSEKFFTGIDPSDPARSDIVSENTIQALVKALADVLKSRGGNNG